MKHVNFFKRVLFVGMFLLSFCFFAIAQRGDSTSWVNKAPWFVQKFKIGAGFFVPINNTDVQVGINGTAHGTDIDFETDLGFVKSIGTFMADFQWRISRKSHLNFSYYRINRNSGHTLDKDIIFKEDTFHANASINSFFDQSIYQLSYGYTLYSNPKFEFGVMIGAHVVGAKAGISLSGTSGSASKSDDFGFTAPLPDLGIWGGYAFTSRLAVSLEANYLSLTIGNITGSILAYKFEIFYNVIKNLDLSLGFTGLNCTVEAEKEHANGRFKWGYNGPSLAAKYSFGKFHR